MSNSRARQIRPLPRSHHEQSPERTGRKSPHLILIKELFVSLQPGIELWCNGSTRDFGSLSQRSNRCSSTEKERKSAPFLLNWCTRPGAECTNMPYVTPSLNPSPRGRDSASEDAARLQARSLRSEFSHTQASSTLSQMSVCTGGLFCTRKVVLEASVCIGGLFCTRRGVLFLLKNIAYICMIDLETIIITL